MIHHFPLFTAAHTLSHNDFHIFAAPFSRIIKEKIATTAQIFFLEDAQQCDTLTEEPAERTLLQHLFITTQQTQAPAAHGSYLLLPFSVQDDQILVAVATGVDSLLVKRIGLDWLQELCTTLQQEFLVLKQANVDLQTGLLNGVHLNTVFNTFQDGENIGLALVEIYPMVRTAMEAMQHVRRSAALLKSFVGDHVPLHHIGHSVFAFVCRSCDEGAFTNFGPRLLAFLKREQCKRAHVGHSQGLISRDSQNGTRRILDEAWLALQMASKRGPYNFCTYRSLQNSQRHALYASVRNIQARLQPHWQHLDQFALVQLQAAHPADNIFDHIHLPFPEWKKFQGPGRDVYLLLPFNAPRKVLASVKEVLQPLLPTSATHSTHAAGIALFPFGDFKKSEMVLNCRKALLHGALLGDGVFTIFDALSQNVSGDIFYGEGDIPRAVREYRRGLVIQPDDINLLNSLGVSYAMLNRHHQANECFLKALAIKKDDFMAWYNLGLGRKLQGDIPGAMESFEHAGACRVEDDQDSRQASRELPLQLGKLYCQTGRYQQTLDILLPWYNREKNTVGAGRALRYLGEAFHGTGRIREAMVWLQRATHFDEFDADALSLLGEIYLDNHEGDQIALKLCEKSVELNPTPPLFHLRLARAQLQCGFPETARDTLRRCLHHPATQNAAQFHMGLLYQKRGQETRAGHWFAKAADLQRNKGTDRHQACIHPMAQQTE